MNPKKVISIVSAYSPWIAAGAPGEWDRLQRSIPEFRRPVFHDLVADIHVSGQIISVAGPRRVGKSTLLRQLVQHLIQDHQVEPDRIVYYSFDDPALYRPGLGGERMMDALMAHMAALGKSGPAYLLLDEIQRLPNWELHLKKYYDLKYPVRLVISGSASSPIFKKTRESLLGRVKDYHVLPFSFREYLLHSLSAAQAPAHLADELASQKRSGDDMWAMFARRPDHLTTRSSDVLPLSAELAEVAGSALRRFLVEGGFPEVWGFGTREEKIEYLFNNQVKKVLTEDLVLAVEFRKPEQLKSFYVSLLEQPGREVNMSKLSGELGINVQQIEKFLPLLEMTDLIRRVGKFRKSAIRVRRGFQKFYPVDLALRNAVLRIGAEILDDATALGVYAESLVFNALKKWPGVLQLDYYREGQKEVDFVVHTRPSRYLPVEVKFRSRPLRSLPGLQEFLARFDCQHPLVVTRDRTDFGDAELAGGERVFQIPLTQFLLMFD